MCVIKMEIKIKCNQCGASHYIKKGFRPTLDRGEIQKYKCLECGKYFTNDEGFYRMRNSEEKITQGIDLYFSNLSSRKVRNHFRRHLDHNASHETILNWCRRYAFKVQQFAETLNPQIGGSCYADGTYIRRFRRDDTFWACVDWETRFINATHYSLHADPEQALIFLKKLTLKKLPKYIQTDNAKFYEKAFRKAFYSNRLQGLKVEHRVVNTYKTGRYNVRIETVFMKIKDRVDDFRGLKALWSAPLLMAGIVIQHNFIEAHTTTGIIPCELADLHLDTGANRWLGLIRLAAAAKN